MAMASPDEVAPRVGANVRAARRSHGMSLETLAGLTGRSKGWLSKIENGRSRLERRQDIAALAAALGVSADGLLGEPAPEIRPDGQLYNIAPLQRALLDAAPDDPPDIPARPFDILRDEVAQADKALCAADHATVIRLLGGAIAELCVHAAGREPDRGAALRVLIRAYGSDSTCALRQIGETNLAWIAGERARQSAELLGDPVWKAAAAFGRAHARNSANMPRALMITPQLADEVEPYIGDDRFAHEAYGMLRLSAALACAVQNDHQGASEQAAEAARLAERDGERPGAWELFGPANAGVWRTSLAVEAGQPEDALSYADGVEPRDLASPNRRAGLRLEKARAHAMLGNDAAAVREMRQAERLSPAQTHNNPFIRELVQYLLPRARREASARDLRGLAWRMNLI
jgi:transcriptional regulator with XRE-family HTH domain